GNYHDRGAEPRRNASGATRLDPAQRAAMRLLPGRSDHAGGGAAEGNAEADRSANHRRDVGQYLPLRHLSADPCGDQGRSGVRRMIRIENLSRRDVLKGLGGASGLVLGFHVPFRKFPAALAAEETDFAPNVYVSIDKSGLVTVFEHRSEMGTGIKTGLPMVLADELRADWNRIKIVQADGDIKYGDQNTDGSRSVRQFYQPFRVAGAMARQLLEEAAARIWKVDPATCQAQDHAVVHQPTGRRLGFGDLVSVAATLPLPSSDHMELQFQPKEARRYVGKSVPIVDLADIVRGQAKYGIDLAVPGMKYASIERCPVYGGAAKSYDAKGPLAVHGVERVIEIPA